MKNLILLLSISMFFLSCSNEDALIPELQSNLFNPPEWIQGNWYGINGAEATTFNFRSNNIIQKTRAGGEVIYVSYFKPQHDNSYTSIIESFYQDTIATMAFSPVYDLTININGSTGLNSNTYIFYQIDSLSFNVYDADQSLGVYNRY
jgi:hypothetical protein